MIFRSTGFDLMKTSTESSFEDAPIARSPFTKAGRIPQAPLLIAAFGFSGIAAVCLEFTFGFWVHIIIQRGGSRGWSRCVIIIKPCTCCTNPKTRLCTCGETSDALRNLMGNKSAYMWQVLTSKRRHVQTSCFPWR